MYRAKRTAILSVKWTARRKKPSSERCVDAYPDHAILAEESGAQGDAGKSEYRWIIDPLDGTTNFLHGFPHYSVSIGLMHKNLLDPGSGLQPFRQ